MNRIATLFALSTFLSCWFASVQPVAAAPFELLDGDRVVFLGDALLEQEQYFGWIEVMLTTSFPDRHITFRNLGWSADTPAGDSRFGLSLLQAGNEPNEEGWSQLVKQIELTNPTVVILGYGMASSLEGGKEGVAKFVEDYQRLIDTIQGISPKSRFVFLSPLGRHDTSEHRQTLAAYSAAIRQLAEQRAQPFVDLSSVATDGSQRQDPIHLNEAGYRSAAQTIQAQLGLKSNWATSEQTESLRKVVLRKSVWWFHRSRPANMAYVFGFRKGEQGRNAGEIPRFDALVAEEESAIAVLRNLQPVPVQEKPAQTESQYAKFTPQATPEFTLGKDLEVTLWAENPQLNKPIQINFDPAGRLWVASSEAYPMIEVGQTAADKILILEDSDGDGKADKSTVFADGLLIPTGVEPGDGGCYVAQSTDLLFMKDTDGDGRADVKTRILSGFGTEDTHHNLHTLRWGPDGRLYMNQSIYTRTDTETPLGVVRLKTGGGFRYHPESMRMEIVFRGLVNSWGHQFDSYGQSFLTDGAGGSGVAYTFPGAAFRPTPKARRFLDLISPGNYPKFASAEIVYGDSFPPDWQGSVITCDFRANRVTRFSMTDQDAGFVTKQEEDLLRTTASTFRPIDVKQGPDGAIYIADWSNPIINHGEVDFRDPRRDRWHGRIWRVTWKGAKGKAKEDLTKLESADLFARLASDDRYTRDQSRRVLLERKDSVAQQVHAWTESVQDEFSKLQSVWLQQGLGNVKHEHLTSLTKAEDPRVRAAAIRMVADLADPQTDARQPLTVADAMKFFHEGVHDPHPRVRLEAVRGLGKIRTAAAASLALEVLNSPMDRFLDYALATTMDELTEPFMEALASQQWQPNSPERERQLAFALTNILPVHATAYLAKYLAEHQISPAGEGPWIELIGKAGGPAELRRLLEQAINGGFNAGATTRSLNAMLEAQRLRRQRPSGDLNGLNPLLDSEDESVRAAAMRVAGAWQLASQVGRLANEAESGKTDGLRGTAIGALREMGNPAVEVLEKLAASADLATRKRSVIALGSLGPRRAAGPFFETVARIEDEQESLGFWREFLATKDAGVALAESFPAAGISAVAARAGLTATKDGGRNEPNLVKALTPYATGAMKAEALTPQRISQMVQLVAKSGDPARGEEVYSRTELACIQCHAIGGVGGKVGPDMTSLGASAPIDYLVESIYDPNAKIKENYHSVIVATEEGQVIAGIEVENTDEELVLRDPNNKLIRIAKDSIAAKRPGKSLMPQGVVDRLSQQEQVDLIAFLSQLGKPGIYDSSKGGVARVYKLLAGDEATVQKVTGQKNLSGSLDDGWKPFWSRVNGSVSVNKLRELLPSAKGPPVTSILLLTEVTASGEAQATFTVEGAERVELWIDGRAVDGKNVFSASLDAGKHQILIRLEAKDLPENFRLVSTDVTFALE